MSESQPPTGQWPPGQRPGGQTPAGQPPAGPPRPGQPPPGWGSVAPPPGWGQHDGGWGGPPPAPKPGSIPLRPLGVGDILEGVFSVLRRHPGATLGSAALVAVIVGLAQLIWLLPFAGELSSLLQVAEQGESDQLMDAAQSVGWGGLLVGGLLVAMLSFALFVVLSGVLAIVVGQSATGARLSFGQAWRRALRRLPRLLAAMLLLGAILGGIWLAVTALWVLAAALNGAVGYVAVGLLTAAAVPLTVYVAVRLALTAPAVALESTETGPISPVTGLRRSWALVHGAWWRTLGLLLLGSIIAGALSQVVAIPASLLAPLLTQTVGGALVASTVASAIASSVIQPLSGLVLALVYVDRRIRTEQLDLALARAAGVEAPPQYR